MSKTLNWPSNLNPQPRRRKGLSESGHHATICKSERSWGHWESSWPTWRRSIRKLTNQQLNCKRWYKGCDKISDRSKCHMINRFKTWMLSASHFKHKWVKLNSQNLRRRCLVWKLKFSSWNRLRRIYCNDSRMSRLSRKFWSLRKLTWCTRFQNHPVLNALTGQTHKWRSPLVACLDAAHSQTWVWSSMVTTHHELRTVLASIRTWSIKSNQGTAPQ